MGTNMINHNFDYPLIDYCERCATEKHKRVLRNIERETIRKITEIFASSNRLDELKKYKLNVGVRLYFDLKRIDEEVKNETL